MQAASFTAGEFALLQEFVRNGDYATVLRILNEADAFAYRNIWNREGDVLRPKGGPFGNTNFIYLRKKGLIVPIGATVANKVVETGLITNHAEAMGLAPHNVHSFFDALRQYQNDDPVLGQASTAESCNACRAKQMIVQARAAAKGLTTAPGMLVMFGATYEDTFTKAGFYDEPYAIDGFIRANHPGVKTMVTIEARDWKDLPAVVQKQFMEHAERHKDASVLGSHSVVYREPTQELHGLLVEGYDLRPGLNGFEGHDLIATSEVSAIRNKCLFDRDGDSKRKKIFESWATPGTLYTFTQEIGPLCYAEAQWGSIATIVTIRNAPEIVARMLQTREIDGMTNADFFRRAQLGYNQPGSLLAVARLPAANNTAQPDWLIVLDEVKKQSSQDAHYDGLKTYDPKVIDFHRPGYKKQFGAPHYAGPKQLAAA